MICQYVIQGGEGYKAEQFGHWTTCLSEALPFESESSAIAYINDHLKPEYGCGPNYTVIQVKAKFIRTQFSSFNMWQVRQLEKAVLVLTPSSVVTENWTRGLEEPGIPGSPGVYTWVDCVATPMQMQAIAFSVSKHTQIVHCDYKF